MVAVSCLASLLHIDMLYQSTAADRHGGGRIDTKTMWGCGLVRQCVLAHYSLGALTGMTCSRSGCRCGCDVMGFPAGASHAV